MAPNAKIDPQDLLDMLGTADLHEILIVGAVMTQFSAECAVMNVSDKLQAVFALFQLEQSAVFVHYLENADKQLSKEVARYFI